MRKNPFSLFQEMDHLFEDMRSTFFDEKWPFITRRNALLSLIIREDEPMFKTPLAKISETKEHFIISAELPGMDKGDLEITIQVGIVEIKDEHKEEKEGKLIRRECRSSSYYRAFNLPEYIDEKNIETNLKKGILNIKTPKVEPSEPEKKKIELI